LAKKLAVTALQSGAADYLLKDRLARLGQAVLNALEQKQLAPSQHSADEASAHSEQRFSRPH